MKELDMKQAELVSGGALTSAGKAFAKLRNRALDNMSRVSFAVQRLGTLLFG